MPINSPNPKYMDMLLSWQRCHDAVDGEERVKRAEDTYLPRLYGQEANEYTAYKMRALFYNASARTVDGCTGSIMRKPPEVQGIEEGDELKDILESIGIGNESADVVIKNVLDEVLTSGRCGIYVDGPEDMDNDDTPYVALYTAENIVNWKTEMIGGEQVLVRIVLRETFEELVDPVKDEYLTEMKFRFRLLLLDTTGETPRYYVQVWREKQVKKEGGAAGEMVSEWIQEGGDIVPKMRGGKPLTFIPFIFASPKGTSTEVQKPPILDLVNVNLSHYRTSADLEHGRHFCALPTFFASGFETKGGTIKIGPGAAIVSADPQAKAGYAELTGAGLTALVVGLDEKEKMMAVLGARLLEEQPGSVAGQSGGGTRETATSTRMRHFGDHSILSNIAMSVSEAITRVYQWIALWIAEPPEKVSEISITLNQDYEFTLMDAQMLPALGNEVAMGRMSWYVYFYNLQKGQLYPEGHTIDDEVGLIGNSGPNQLPGKLVPGIATVPIKPNKTKPVNKELTGPISGERESGEPGNASGTQEPPTGKPISRPLPALQQNASA